MAIVEIIQWIENAVFEMNNFFVDNAMKIISQHSEQAVYLTVIRIGVVTESVFL
jgi:hypothetical protein